MGKAFKLLLLIFIPIIAIGFFIFFIQKSNTNSIITSDGKTAFVPLEVSAQEEETSWLAPNGKDMLTLIKETNDSQTTYTFTTENGVFYNFTVPGTSLVSIPFNTWSVDNKHFFIKLDNNFLVINGNGEALNVNDHFTEKYTDLVIEDVTGWAANTLLLVNTKKLDGSLGPSLWFDVTTFKFTQLSHRFN